MKLIDKDALVAEIKRRIKEIEEIETYLTLTNLLCYIDSLQEEPVSIDFEKELYKAFGQVKDFTLGMRIANWFYDMGKNSQEPVSEDLEEAVNTYIGYPPEVDECSSVYGKRQAFKAGAKWQKQQDSIPSKDLAELIDTLSKRYPEVSFAKLSRIAVRVAKWQKQQMINGAVETIIDSKPNDYGEFIPIVHVKVGSSYKYGEKVKVIIIKEDICG